MNKDKIKSVVLSAIGGAIIAMIIGFAWGGWVSANTSGERGREMARKAVVDRLTPMCMAMFNQDPAKDSKLIEFKKVDSWKIDQYVKQQGWATMPFEKEPDSQVADTCSALIMKNNS
ncbi:MAG: hypothetical protein ABIK68_00840 [bacterium]